MKSPCLTSLIFFALLVEACGSLTSMPTTLTALPPSPAPTDKVEPILTPTLTEISSPPPATSCRDWQSFPVIPTVSEGMRALYRGGQESVNQAGAFTKIGDGEISTSWFFTAFDLGEDYYDLGPYKDLARVIEHFKGSFGRIGMAARRGFNTERILDSASSDASLCEAGESPLICELRVHKPAFAILSLGTNQVWQPEEFESGMRQILDILLSQNVVPILSTKGDNLEGDHRINQTIACLAEEYGVPLWNFWAAIQPLPNHGLQPDLEHLTYGITDFDDADAMLSAWTVRNLTALQALDSVWRGVAAQP